MGNSKRAGAAGLSYVFNIGARVNGDDITMLDAKVVTDNAVQAGAAIVKVVVGENDQDGVLALLAADEDGIAAEELQGLHRRGVHRRDYYSR